MAEQSVDFYNTEQLKVHVSSSLSSLVEREASLALDGWGSLILFSRSIKTIP